MFNITFKVRALFHDLSNEVRLS